MSEFQKFYLWGMHAKFSMGLYFAALVFLGGILTALYGGTSLALMTLLQMFLLSLVIAFVQAWLIPAESDFTKVGLHIRMLVWLLGASFATALCAQFLNWLPGLPFWCPWLLGAFMLFGCGAMLLGQKFEQDADTVRLNQQLKEYQEKP